MGEKLEYGIRYFLVKWKGWPESDNTWEVDKSVDCLDLIEKFRDSCRSASGKSNKRSAANTPKASKAKKAKRARKQSVSEDDDDNDDIDDDDDENEDGSSEEKEWEVSTRKMKCITAFVYTQSIET